MPEAAVDENDRSISRQDDVRAPWQALVVYAIAKSQPPKGITQTQLRLGGGGVDLRHDVMTLLGGEDIRHPLSMLMLSYAKIGGFSDNANLIWRKGPIEKAFSSPDKCMAQA